MPVDGFKWLKNTSKFNEDFIKNYNKDSDKGYFLTVGVQDPEKLHDLHNSLPFISEKHKTEKVKKLAANLHIK